MDGDVDSGLLHSFCHWRKKAKEEKERKKERKKEREKRLGFDLCLILGLGLRGCL